VPLCAISEARDKSDCGPERDKPSTRDGTGDPSPTTRPELDNLYPARVPVVPAQSEYDSTGLATCLLLSRTQQRARSAKMLSGRGGILPIPAMNGLVLTAG
jgi:hypothetical protein